MGNSKGSLILTLCTMVFALAFTAALPEAVAQLGDDDDDEFCFCWNRCCSFPDPFFDEPFLTAQGAADQIPVKEFTCLKCRTERFELCSVFEDDDDDDIPENAGSAIIIRPRFCAFDTDGDKICDHCDNCEETPNGFLGEVPCEEDPCFIKRAPAGAADETCMSPLVDQADEDMNGVGDACEPEDEPPPPTVPQGQPPEETGGGQAAGPIVCLTGGGPGGFNNGTCGTTTCSLNATGATPWQVLFGAFAFLLAPWMFRRAWAVSRNPRQHHRGRANAGIQRKGRSMLKIFSFLIASTLALTLVSSPVQATEENGYCFCWEKCCGFPILPGDLQEPMSALLPDNVIPILDKDPFICINCTTRQFEIEFCPIDEASASNGFCVQDTDGDEICDHCDNCPNDDNGIIEIACEDNRCPDARREATGEADDDDDDCEGTVPGVDQADADENGVGDACEGQNN